MAAVLCCSGSKWHFPRELQSGGPGPRGRVGKGKSKYLGSGGCFMLFWEQMTLSEGAAIGRARATGKGREGEI